MTTDESAASPWWKWLQRLLEDRAMTPAELGVLAGLERSRLTRWRQGEKPNLDNARRVAKALGVTPLEVMVGFHLITADEAGQRVTSPDPEVLTDQQLVAELTRRLKRLSAGGPSGAQSSDDT